MAAKRHDGSLREIRILFDEGSVAGLTDRQLLERLRTKTGDSAELAFSALMERHGPMVARVCRDVLWDANDVNDAFQATFLVLILKAPSIRKRDSLASWLYGVAQRVAAESRSAAARRKIHERRASERRIHLVKDTIDDDPGPILHDELSRLPSRYRAPLILFYMEGRTCEEVAQQLDLPVGTVKSQLSRGRERLRRRLLRRGFGPAIVTLEALLTGETAQAASLAATTRAAFRLAALRASGAGAVPVGVAVLAERVLRSMLVSTVKGALSFALAGAALLVALTISQAGDDNANPPPGPPKPATAATDADRSMRVMLIRVIDVRDKKPLKGVALRVDVNGRPKSNVVTDGEGSLKLTFPPGEPKSVSVWAKKDGFVPVSVSWGSVNDASALPTFYAIELEPGTMLGGLVKDEQGQPIEGATVFLLATRPPRWGQQRPDIWDYPVKTNAQGRWHCDCLSASLDEVLIRLSHPDYVSDTSYGATPRPTIEQLRDQTGVMVMKKGHVLKGRVLDLEGKPVAKATVAQGSDRHGTHYPTTETDAEGRFTFPPVAAGEVILTVQARGHAPGLKAVVATRNINPVEFRLGPGHVIQGRIVDPADRPIAGAIVAVDTWRTHRSLNWRVETDAEGRFRWDEAPEDPVTIDTGKQGFIWIRRHEIRASAAEVAITIHPTWRISGRVTDAETGKSIEKFSVLRQGEKIN
jgi:RNA polymerase sigma factor (sigma-70 family)